MKYTPHTQEDIQKALETVGVDSIDDLFADIPKSLQNPAIDIPKGLDETELLAHMKALAQKNRTEGPNFLGAGMRKHFVPAVVDALTFQSEFVTAYTPYQPEVSQGLLQAMFEYQSMIAVLTGLDVSNSSLYDGATAVAEAALLAMRQTNRSKIVISRGVHPEYRETLQTFLSSIEAPIETIDLVETKTPLTKIEGAAALIVQTPNFLGSIENMAELAEAAHQAGSLFIAVVDPLSLAILKCPGEYGADIAVGDGQVIGNSPNFGGPSYGFIAVKDELTRQLPGRLVGMTKDVDGKRGFVLTLQAREQHIRRAKAKSNICSNHALMALQSAIYLASLGPEGLREAAINSSFMSGELEMMFKDLGLKLVTKGRFFNEFAVQLPKNPLEIRNELAKRGVHGCNPVAEEYKQGFAGIFATTELTNQEGIAQLKAALSEII